MRSNFFVFLALCLALCIYGKFIDRLSYDDLSSVVGPAPALLIFTVSWCEHCKAVQPEIALIAKAVKSNPEITVARIDADEEPAIVDKFHVQSFPTFLYTPPGFSLKERKEPEEFTDYRWAELMAEFVNNETQAETVKIEPRQKFLNWRKKVPYNKGKQPRIRYEQDPTPTPHPEGLDPIQGVDEAGMEIRDPIVLNSDDFDNVVIKNETESFVVYFYTRDDPMQREYLIQWRQAASAFLPEDHVTLAMMNVENGENGKIAERYGVTDTPKVLYFARCNTRQAKKKDFVCKKPNSCGEGCEDTDTIINFVSEQMMIEMGVDPNNPSEGDEDVVTLTDEEYQKLVKEGKIFPVDPSTGEDAAAKTDNEAISGDLNADAGASKNEDAESQTKAQAGAEADSPTDEGKTEL